MSSAEAPLEAAAAAAAAAPLPASLGAPEAVGAVGGYSSSGLRGNSAAIREKGKQRVQLGRCRSRNGRDQRVLTLPIDACPT